jgi:hypothetical protein
MSQIWCFKEWLASYLLNDRPYGGNLNIKIIIRKKDKQFI